VRLFRYHVQYDTLRSGKKWKGTVVEIHVSHDIDFKWNHSNLEAGRVHGRRAAEKAIEAYKSAGEKSAKSNKKVRFIP